jgi:hypothetical protein
MTNERLTELLVGKLLGWSVFPDRFIKSSRSWIPRWRFQPFARLEDAFLLLDKSGGTYLLALDLPGVFTAEVRIGERIGKATGEPKAQAITLALSRALGNRDGVMWRH